MFHLEVFKGLPRLQNRRLPMIVTQNAAHDICKVLERSFERHPEQPSDKTEFDEVMDIWYMVIEMAICTPADESAQDRLVEVVVDVGQAQNEMAADGYLWAKRELPSMAWVLTATWLKRLMELMTNERLSLAAFTARLVAADASESKLGYCAVLVLRETLETPRPLQLTDKHGEFDVSVADLLPAVVAWFEFAGHKLAILSGEQGYESLTEEQIELATVGELAQKAGILQPGFSTERWRFWHQRLETLSSDDNKEVSEWAQHALDTMSLWKDTVG